MSNTAYLIVICDRETNKILKAEIWSSPEWEQSRCLDQPTYVAFSVRSSSFSQAIKMLLWFISHERSRYYPLVKYLNEEYKNQVVDNMTLKTSIDASPTPP